MVMVDDGIDMAEKNRPFIVAIMVQMAGMRKATKSTKQPG